MRSGMTPVTLKATFEIGFPDVDTGRFSTWKIRRFRRRLTPCCENAHQHLWKLRDFSLNLENCYKRTVILTWKMLKNTFLFYITVKNCKSQ